MEKVLNYFSQIDSWISAIAVVFTICSVIKTAVNKIRNWFRRKSLKKLLCYDDVEIHIPTRKIDNRIKPVIAMEDYNTAEKIRLILDENNFKTRIKYIPADGEIEFDSTKANVVICGPKNSTTIKNLFEGFEQLIFDEDKNGWHFEDKNTHTKLYSEQENKTEQYAFLGKVKQGDHVFVLICGIHAIGSDGVAYFLSDRKKLDELLKKVKGNLFWCVIKSSYSDYNKQIYDADLTNHIQIIQ